MSGVEGSGKVESVIIAKKDKPAVVAEQILGTIMKVIKAHRRMQSKWSGWPKDRQTRNERTKRKSDNVLEGGEQGAKSGKCEASVLKWWRWKVADLEWQYFKNYWREEH